MRRIVDVCMCVLLLLSFAMTAISGMAMSKHAVPFMNGLTPVSLARQVHLAMSHWSFVLMGTHLGLHMPAMAAGMKLTGKKKAIMTAAFCCIACVGLYLFLRNGMADYMFFRAGFAFLDYDKAGALVILENILMLLFWAFIGDRIAVLCKRNV